MLFSSASPRQRIVTLRAWVEKNMRRLPGRVAGADDVDVQPVRVRRLAARGAVEDALAGQPVEARRSASCRHATPQARMIVRARRTSPPSRWTWRVAGSIRVIERVTRISAPSRRACCSARLASSSPETPDGKPR